MDGKRGGTRTGGKEKYLTAWEVSNCKKKFRCSSQTQSITHAPVPARRHVVLDTALWTSVLPSHLPSSGASATSAALQDPSHHGPAACDAARRRRRPLVRARGSVENADVDVRGRRLRLGPRCSGWRGRPAPGRPRAPPRPRAGRGAASAWAADGGEERRLAGRGRVGFLDGRGGSALGGGGRWGL